MMELSGANAGGAGANAGGAGDPLDPRSELQLDIRQRGYNLKYPSLCL
jgi:hypothetical protein